MKGSFFDLETQTLVAQAASWGLASLPAEHPRPTQQDAVGAMLAEVGDRKLLCCAAQAKQGSEKSYHRLFRPGETVSPREVSYCGFEDPGRLMAELNFFYHAFSYLPHREEFIDHASVVAGFVGYLFLKVAYCPRPGRFCCRRNRQNARTRFMDEHFPRCATGRLDRLTANEAYHAISFLMARGTGATRPVSGWAAIGTTAGEVRATACCKFCTISPFFTDAPMLEKSFPALEIAKLSFIASWHSACSI